MTTCIGPKVKFELLQHKMDLFNQTYDYNQLNSIQQLMERKVSFADSSIVFLHYSEEMIFHFRSRLKSQVQAKHIEPLFLNPQLCDSNLQNKKKSCFKELQNKGN
ncbi:unnamed protein product [Paramecium sonneborni]|uniref:Uncharacterized protein n=1 Tax=Paramecium sonneborni TaxID=65129 RepID=A0A8S1QNX5_9CILI|nr:unnamed protein product [Paramecium sonneborni]